MPQGLTVIDVCSHVYYTLHLYLGKHAGEVSKERTLLKNRLMHAIVQSMLLSGPLFVHPFAERKVATHVDLDPQWPVMKIENLHPWDLSLMQAISLQKELAKRLRDASFPLSAARLVGGIDVSSSKESSLLTAGVVIWNSDTGAVEEAVFAQRESAMPYVTGLLSFREIPAITEALKKVTVQPDIFLVDGQGRAHPRSLGIAAHLGLLLSVPTVGVGKSKLMGEEEEPGSHVGDKTPLIQKGETVGYVLRTREGVKPLYISAGNNITLHDSVAVVLKCVRGYRLPEPTRLAHMHVNLARMTGRGLQVSGASLAIN